MRRITPPRVLLARNKNGFCEMLGDDKGIRVSSSASRIRPMLGQLLLSDPPIIDFKREVYRRALLQLATHLPLAS